MPVPSSSLSQELPAGLLPALPPAPGGPAAWVRRRVRVLRRSTYSDTWLQDLLSREGPEFEAVRLLGGAWRSPVATAVRLGQHVDLVEVPEAVASPAWHHLRRGDVPCGAVFAAGDRWSFVVQTRLGRLTWPAEARYLTNCCASIPARGARDETHALWWISRPVSGLFTHPYALAAALTTFAGSPSSSPPHVTEPTEQARSRTASLLPAPLCSPSV
ncbi:hypothetical protein OG241_08760 [Streptomyces sp. NBC_01390]|uniref:hypothetical protein n=1 Tax=Streptomyces sp. NBC_01390 TaxID=2903850 RepID=UPI00324F7FA8